MRSTSVLPASALISAAFLLGLLLGASTATADTIKSTSQGSSFKSNDSLPWASLGTNISVPNGTVATSIDGLQVTIGFALGGPGSTMLECPATGCTWAGNFSPGQTLLTTINTNTGTGEGSLDLSLSQGIAGVGFQIEPNPVDGGEFQAEIAAYDGSILLGTFFETGDATSGRNNSALFFGVEDLTGTNITSIRVDTFDCAGGVDAHCMDGFGINDLRLWENSPYPPIPEPGSLMLLASGLGALGVLRRKLTDCQ